MSPFKYLIRNIIQIIWGGIISITIFSCDSGQQKMTNGNSDFFNDLKDSSDYFKSRNLDSAISYANKALNLSIKQDEKRNMAISYAKLGYLFLDSENYDTALTLFQKSYLIRENLGDQKFLSSSYLHFGTVYTDLKQYNKAIESIKKYQSIRFKLNDTSAIINAYNNLGIIAGYSGSYDSSKNYFLKALNYAQETKDTQNILNCRNNIGLAYSKIDKPDSSIFYFGENYKYYINTDETNEIVGLLTNIGNSYISIGNYSQAFRYLKNAYKNSLLTGNKKYQSTSSASLRDYYFKTNQIDSAYKYLKIYNNLAEQRYKNNLAKSLANAEAKYELKRVELKKSFFEKEAIKNSKIKKILFIVLALVVIIALAVLINIQQKRRLAEKEAEIHQERVDKLLREHEMKNFETMVEAQEEERKRIAEDLHDRLGSMLAAVKLHFNSIEEQVKALQAENEIQYQKAYELLDSAAQEVRNISHDMLSNVLVKFGLMPALYDLQETIVSSGQIKMEVFAHGMNNRLENNIEIAIYRVIQELVSNILKHAKATKIEIELNMVNEDLNILVQDDGKGFDRNKNLSFGIGLQNIERRLFAINGEMKIESVKNKGTTVIIDILSNHDKSNIS